MSNRQRRFKIGTASIRSLCAGILGALGAKACEVSVVLVGDRTMRDLNRHFRGRDYATDVLSFDYGGKGESGVPFLGEIVVSPSTALCQSLRWRSTHDREMRRLLVHGMLHLLGYDHTSDQGEHLAVQRRLLRRRFASCRPAVVERRRRR